MTTDVVSNGVPAMMPPQNLEAERAVIGGLLLDNSTMSQIRDLKPDDFFRDAHRVIYSAILDLRDCMKAVDAVTLADELTRREQYQQIGGDEMLLEIAQSVPDAANIKYHAEIVRQKSLVRLCIQAATEIIRDGYSGPVDYQEFMGAVEGKLLSVLAESTGHKLEVIDLMTCDYRIYLLTDHWKAVKDKTLAIFSHRCAICDSPERLDVHHRTYFRRGCEEVLDTIPLCRDCHDLFHRNGKLWKPPAYDPEAGSPF